MDIKRQLLKIAFSNRNAPVPGLESFHNVSRDAEVEESIAPIVQEVLERAAKKHRYRYLFQVQKRRRNYGKATVRVFSHNDVKVCLGEFYEYDYKVAISNCDIAAYSSRQDFKTTSDAARAVSLITKWFKYDTLMRDAESLYSGINADVRNALSAANDKFNREVGVTFTKSKAVMAFRELFGEDAYKRFAEYRGCIDDYDALTTMMSIVDRGSNYPIEHSALYYVGRRDDGMYLVQGELGRDAQGLSGWYSKLPDAVRAHVGMLDIADQNKFFIRDVGYRSNDNEYLVATREGDDAGA